VVINTNVDVAELSGTAASDVPFVFKIHVCVARLNRVLSSNERIGFESRVVFFVSLLLYSIYNTFYMTCSGI
jgi:hypothetical protein